METASPDFELIYNLGIVKVQQLQGEIPPAYKVNFSNEVPELVICQMNNDGTSSWDTIPPGNTELATGIGKLIEERNAGSK